MLPKRLLLGGRLCGFLRPAGDAAPSLGGLKQHILRFGRMLLRGGGLSNLLVDDAASSLGGLG